MGSIQRGRCYIKLINHIFLIFKQSLYELRKQNVRPSIFYICNRIKQIRNIEYIIAKDASKLNFHYKKWDILKDSLN